MGEFLMKVEGQAVGQWHAGKARSLFQYLLVNREQVVLRERLYEILWPDREWSPGSSSLKVAAHALRHLLAGQSPVEGRAPIRIEYKDFGYVLRAADICVDAERLQAALSDGRAAELRSDDGVATAMYQRAAALHQGDYLAGESADWIDEQREWYRSRTLRALAYLRTRALARNDYAEVVTWSQQALAIDRYHEESYQALMIAHGRLGELGRVQGWHELCQRRLSGELHVTLTHETERIRALAMRGSLRQGARVPSAA